MEFKRTILAITCSIILLSAHFVYADQRLDEHSCSDVNVADQLGPIRDQGNIGWCYANVAADLITFHYQLALHGQQASAGYVALTFNEYRLHKPNVDAGLISPATVFSQFNGICPQSFQDEALKNSPFKTIREQIDALVAFKEEYDKRKTLKLDTSNFTILDTYRNSKSYINFFSDQELQDLLDTSTVSNFPRKLAQRLCKSRLIYVRPDLKIRAQTGFIEGWKNFLPNIFKTRKYVPAPLVGRADLIKEIHEELDKDNFVALSYVTRIFYDPTSERYKKAGLHASGIVGRRWNKQDKVCEFKLRNSWGKTCASYTNPELKGKCDPQTGYVWIPDSIMQRTVSDVVYFKKN